MVPRARSALLVSLVTTMAAAPLAGAVHRMFVTSATGNGDLGNWPLIQSQGLHGLAAGDAICKALAAAIPGANPDAFRAWLSSDNTDAFCHVAGFNGKVSDKCNQGTLPNAGPWVRTDGKPFSQRLKPLTDPATAKILYPGFVDENGTGVAPGDVFTGTESTGVAYEANNAAVDCNDGSGAWRSGSTHDHGRVGSNHSGVTWWTSGATRSCDSTARLFCFEQGVGDPLPPFGKPGAYVFVSSESGTGNLSTWPDAHGLTGVAAGDAVCQTLAASAGYPSPGSFRAWLSVSGQPAIDRLVIDGPWRRPGGVEIAADRAQLTSAEPESDVEADEKGVHEPGGVETGTYTNGQPSGFDCDGWTSSLASDSVTWGSRNSASFSWTDAGVTNCGDPFRLYCFSNVVTLLNDGFESGDRSVWDAHSP